LLEAPDALLREPDVEQVIDGMKEFMEYSQL
jgi:hypothetical protein